MAFALGRPDTLGMDEYHNCQRPNVDDSAFAIIPCMVTFSQVIREVSTRIYSSSLTWQEKLLNAARIQAELDAWVEGLPPTIKPDTTIQGRLSHLNLREPKWCRRQRLIARLRTYPHTGLHPKEKGPLTSYQGYYNVKALLFLPFLSPAIHYSAPALPELIDAVRKCTGAARKTIEIIHETFRLNDFFRTW
jgi:hypothetical protein